jgi:hypothetical protein
MTKAKQNRAIPSKREQHLLSAAIAIRHHPNDADRAYLTRQLILCTLPHTDPGDVSIWIRRFEEHSICLVPARNIFEGGRSIGLPYGVIPRLLLFWIITEAIRTQNRRLTLGHSMLAFMRQVCYLEDGGYNYKRFHEQAMRLFRCQISFQTNLGQKWSDFQIAPKGELWWTLHEENPAPSSAPEKESWIELGETFYNNILASKHVPLDVRALKGLRNSPLALDLYGLICYKAFPIVKFRLDPQFIAYKELMFQLGGEYCQEKDLKKKVWLTIPKILAVYPGLKVEKTRGGFILSATRLAVPEQFTPGQILSY